jgi:hypothetical protein
MKAKLALSLTGNQVLLEFMPAPKGALLKLMRAAWPWAKAETIPKPRTPVTFTLSADFTGPEFQSNLDEAVARLEIGEGPLPSGLELEVQLGLTHAHIGLMVLDDVAATALTAATRETFAQAWVARMLHLDPARQIVRWQILADPRKLLISCVDRNLFEALGEFAQRRRYRFSSCRPALLSTIAAQRQNESASALTIVWTEPGTSAARSSSVQLLRFENRQLTATWRGWAPLVVEGVDSALEGALRRFGARHSAQADETVKRLHWPALSTGMGREK